MSFTIVDLVSSVLAILAAQTGHDAGVATAHLVTDALILAGLGGILYKAKQPAIACVIPFYAEIKILDAIGGPRWWSVILLAPTSVIVASLLESA